MKHKLLLFFSTLLICFIASEVILRVLIEKDSDNNLSLGNLHLKPFQLPIIETQLKIEKLLSVSKRKNLMNIRLVPDSSLGWLPNSEYETKENMYKYDSTKIRTSVYNESNKDTNRIKVAIFGDSYAHGDEVKFENTIGYYLEELLNKNNFQTEVLNFAVSGYGFDQAYLRFEQINQDFKPDIVVLGIQFENVKRHINILRPFYFFTTEIPYSKPRFIINDSNLQLIDNPITDISKTIEIIKNFDVWEYSKYEGFYDRSDYKTNLLYEILSYSAISSLVSTLHAEFEFYRPKSESYIITKKIIQAFLISCSLNNQVFIPVHLPTINDLSFLQSSLLEVLHGQKYIYNHLLKDIKSEMKIVETIDSLEKWGDLHGLKELFMKRHYSPIANKIIAEQICTFIISEYSHLNERHTK